MPAPATRLRGVFAPVVTPFCADLEVDAKAFVAHCRWLLEHGAGLAVFGTNSEANSLSFGERLALLEVLRDAGITGSRLLPGTGCCNLPETVALTKASLELGAAGALVLPPFFYKGLGGDGLLAYYSEVIERVGDDRLALYLYNIPAVSHVRIEPLLVERLLARYPRHVAGLKDSSGDQHYLHAMLTAFAPRGLAIFPASEALLEEAMPLAAAGCISATANVNPRGIRATFDAIERGDADAPLLQRQVSRVRSVFERYPMIAAMKHVLAAWRDHPDWAVVRPPLETLPRDQGAALLTEIAQAGLAC